MVGYVTHELADLERINILRYKVEIAVRLLCVVRHCTVAEQQQQQQ